MNRDYFVDLSDYNRWVSDTVIGWLNQLSDQQWNQCMTSSFGSIRDTTLHLVSAEKIWLDFWQQTPDPQFLSRTFTGTKQELIQIWIQTSAAVQAVIGSYPKEQYDQPVRFGWQGAAWQMTFWQTVAHFTNHATYHRGQLVTLLRQAGFTDLSSTDLATFLRNRQQVEASEA